MEEDKGGTSCRPHVHFCLCRCATPFGVDVVGITEFIALIGALVGGIVARQRKQETERLNEQLRKINMQLRQQARAGTLYAPGLSYAPVPQASVAAPVAPGAEAREPGTSASTTPVAIASTDEPDSPEQEACRNVLREGKRLLRSQQGKPPAYMHGPIPRPPSLHTWPVPFCFRATFQQDHSESPDCTAACPSSCMRTLPHQRSTCRCEDAVLRGKLGQASYATRPGGTSLVAPGRPMGQDSPRNSLSPLRGWREQA
jgi:hypothetical protein